MDAKEFAGRWFLPAREAESVFGVLRISESGDSLLSLSGALLGEQHVQGETFAPPIVLGISDRGVPLTLVRCHERGISRSFRNEQRAIRSTVDTQIVLEGIHIPNLESVQLSRVEADFDYLAEWASVSGFEQPRPRNSRDIAANVVARAKYRWITPRPATVNGVQMGLSIGFSGRGDHRNSIELIQTTRWFVASNVPLHIDAYLNDYLRPFRDLLTLTVGYPSRQLGLKGLVLLNPHAQPSSHGEEFRNRRDVKIYIQVDKGRSNQREVHSHEMLFTYPMIQRNLETKLKQWFESRKTLTPVHNLYFSTRYLEGQYLETQLISMAQALETYHRRRYRGRLVTNERAEALKDAIRSSLAPVFSRRPRGLSTVKWEELRQAVLRGLLFFNHYGLQQRVREVVETLPASSVFVPDVTDFAQSLARTRNYLTHFDPSNEDEAAHGSELLRLVGRVRALLEICLLSELDFSNEKITQLISRHERYTGIAEWQFLHE